MLKVYQILPPRCAVLWVAEEKNSAGEDGREGEQRQAREDPDKIDVRAKAARRPRHRAAQLSEREQARYWQHQYLDSDTFSKKYSYDAS